jgi:EmrB/QacA subfamily drug resistance transporter
MSAPVALARGLSLSEPAGKWVVAAAVLGSGLAGIDATVVNIALPALGSDLHAGIEGLQWTINGYTLTLASFILLGGSLGDRFGRRRVFIIGTLWFAVASALCALAPTIEILVAARALQGVGGALLTPGSLAIIAASFNEHDRPAAIGAWSGFGGVASAIGPFLGGWLVAGPGWRWVFLINLPLALIVIAIAARHVPESSDPNAPKHLDLAGAALGAVGLAGITYALIAAGSGWTTVNTVSAVIGIAALFGFVLNEIRSPYPMVPPRMFANPQFTASNLVTLLVYAALSGVFFFLVVDLQVVAGFSPLLAGTALLPVTVIMLALSARAGALAGRIGPRLPMTLGPLIAALGLILMMRIGPGASYITDVLPGVTVFGLGLATFVAPLTATVLGAADPEHAGIASGINNAVARAAGLLAVATLPVLVGLTGDDYQQPATFAAGFNMALMICAGLLIAGGLLAAATIRNPKRLETIDHHYCAVAGPPIQAARAD